MPVPWTQIIQWVPPIVELSRDLVQRTKRKPEPGEDDVRGRLAALEEGEKRQAELVSRMAQHQAQLSEAVLSLHAQARRLEIVVWIAAAVVAVALIAVVLLLVTR